MILIILSLMMIAFCLRGGRLHNHLVLQTEKILNQNGFNTLQEHPKKLPDGKLDFVDILAKKDSVLICFEIETTPRYVLTNADKARQLGIPMIVIVPNKKVQKAVTNKLNHSREPPGGKPICILLLNQLNKELKNYLSQFIEANN